MLTFSLPRLAETDCSTHGKIFLPDGKWLVDTLERGSRNPDGHSRIPAGTYPIDVRSPPYHSKFDVTLRDPRYLGSDYHGILWIPDGHIPGRSAIEFHPANWYTELEGCIATGEITNTDAKGDFWISESRKAYCRFYPVILAAIKVGGAQIAISDPGP